MAIVTQEPFLFNSSIKDNISYGSENVNFKEIHNAAEKSQAIEFISKLKMVDTLIGEEDKLYQERQQRISLPGSIKKTRYFNIDEATSSVDNKTVN